MSDRPVVLVLQTPVAPLRVITLSFGAVDIAGIPMDAGREHVCHERRGMDPPGVPCAVVDRGDRVEILIADRTIGRHVVVQAAWLAEGAAQVSASWGFQVPPPAH
ncbi:MAG: hypothetical protein ACRDQ0_03305 [Pseudonocardia sp.]